MNVYTDWVKGRRMRIPSGHLFVYRKARAVSVHLTPADLGE